MPGIDVHDGPEYAFSVPVHPGTRPGGYRGGLCTLSKSPGARLGLGVESVNGVPTRAFATTPPRLQRLAGPHCPV